MDNTPDNALDRRSLLRGVAAAALPLAVAQAGLADEPRAANGPAPQPAVYPGLILRTHSPDNLEFPFPSLDRFLIPTERFFVRSHFPVPDLEPRTWRLRVEGEVERPLELSFDEIRKLPTRSVVALLECSGNSRVFLTPKPAGVLWELGAVGTAEWEGVPLSAVLDRAGVKQGAAEVILVGADSGEVREFPNPYQSPGRIPFARSLPLHKARQPEVLLAYRMNGADLTPAHGYPLRVVVPGWYGMASIKWLAKIIVTDRPFQGFFQTMEYAYYEPRHGLPSLTPVTELQVKSEVARPALYETVPAGQPYRVHGAAWTGESEIARVEVSTDGGQTWEPARLLDRSAPFAWRLWEYTWRNPRPGRQVVLSRATDKRGRTQPLERDVNRRNTMINHVLAMPVQVGG